MTVGKLRLFFPRGVRGRGFISLTQFIHFLITFIFTFIFTFYSLHLPSILLSSPISDSHSLFPPHSLLVSHSFVSINFISPHINNDPLEIHSFGHVSWHSLQGPCSPGWSCK